MKHLFRSLQHHNYRLFFCGQSVSLIGTWMTRVATAWLVYRLTHSALMLGITAFANQLPYFLLGPIAGVFADQWNRRKILIITQIASMVQVFVLGFMTWTHQVTMSHILFLSLIQGIINAFDVPARQAFMAEMIDAKADLGNAIALNSSMFNVARLIGPAAAGFLIAAKGEGMCFFVDALTYLAVMASFFCMNIKPANVPTIRIHLMQELKEGIQYVQRSASIVAILAIVAWISLMGMPYLVLFPVFAKEILKSGPYALGVLTSASGLGALCGGLFLALRKNGLNLTKYMMVGMSAGSIGLICFAFANSLVTSFLFILIISFGLMIVMVSSHTVLQTIVDDDKRGRIMSFYSMGFMGMMPFGSLVVGALAHYMDVRTAILFCGCSCLGALFLFAYKASILKSVLAIYVREEIAPEVEPDSDFSIHLKSA